MKQIESDIERAVNKHFRNLGGSVIFSTQNPLTYIPLHMAPKRWRWLLSKVALSAVRGSIIAHSNYRTFHTALSSLENVGGTRIFESGSSAYGTNSTHLLAQIASIAGCGFDTVDIDPTTCENAAKLLTGDDQSAHCGDSAKYLQETKYTYCFAYLDSFDLVHGQYAESAEHGLKEFMALQGKLSPGATILIDDTPRTPGVFRSVGGKEQERHARAWIEEHGHMPGKGAHIIKWVRDNAGYDVIDWGYQLVLKYNPPASG